MNNTLEHQIAETDEITTQTSFEMTPTDAWSIIADKIAQRVSGASGGFLARPDVTEDTTRWMSSTPLAQPIADLPDAEQHEIRQMVAQTLTEIDALAKRLINAKSPELLRQGAALRMVKVHATDDMIHVSNGQPILVDWIAQPSTAPRPVTQAQTPPTRMEDPGAQTTTIQTGNTSNRLVPIGNGTPPPSPFWSRLFVGLFSLTFLLLALLVGRILVSACGLAWPLIFTGGEQRPILSYCSDEPSSNDSLLEEIARLEADLDAKISQCEIPSDPVEPEPVPVPAPEPEPEPISGRLRTENISPAIGDMCNYAICNPQGGWRTSSNQCENEPDWAADLRADIEVGMCRVYMYPTSQVVPAGTKFTAELSLEVNGDQVESWQFKSKTIPEKMRKALERSGKPHLYWAGSFPWPYPLE